MPLRGSLLRPLAAILALAGLAGLTTPTYSAPPLSGSARAAINTFLVRQTAGLPGKVVISIDAPRLDALPPCEALEPFLPSGAQLWGRVSVGVRCHEGRPWTRYVPAHVAVVSTYYVAAHPIEMGQALTAIDAVAREGDLTALPRSVIVDPAQLKGVIASNRIALGAPIRSDLLRAVALVQRGQYVKIISQGAGFVVSAEGKALTDAAVGAIVQVKIPGGSVLSGIVLPSGIVERRS